MMLLFKWFSKTNLTPNKYKINVNSVNEIFPFWICVFRKDNSPVSNHECCKKLLGMVTQKRTLDSHCIPEFESKNSSSNCER